MEGQSSPQEAWRGGLCLAQPEGAWRNISARNQTSGAPWGLAVCRLQSSPGRVPELEGKGGPGTPADLGQTWAMERSGTEARRMSVRKGWMLGTACA